METQKAIAQILGVTPQYLSMVKNGKRNAGFSLAKKLGDYLGVEYSVFIEGSQAERLAAFSVFGNGGTEDGRD